MDEYVIITFDPNPPFPMRDTIGTFKSEHDAESWFREHNPNGEPHLTRQLTKPKP